MTDYSKIFGTMPLTSLRSIFSKPNIENPMQLIFNTPVTSNSFSKSLGITVNTEKIVSVFISDYAVDFTLRLNHPNTFQAFPFFCIHQKLSITHCPEFQAVRDFFNG